AIKGWDKRSFYYYQMLEAVADHYNFDFDVAYQDLDSESKIIILDGSGSTKIAFIYSNDRGDLITRNHEFEG
ncbi:hypothetical protein V6257_20925, partial [Pseudoalteromonas issachenkonii]